MQPFRIVMKNRAVFGMAGFYDIWQDPRGDEFRTCTIFTTKPNRLLSDLVDRMPVILSEEAMDTWLNPRVTDREVLHALLQPLEAEMMAVYPVSPSVNDIGNETPECVEEWDARLPLVKV
jgi:putative SOS response-associated peptidase YedK